MSPIYNLEAGEPDVPGLYAYLMRKVWKLTGDEKYLVEAKAGAQALHGLDFALGYQFNNTAWAAIAMLEMWLETEDTQYLGLAHVCLAGTLHNMALWECTFGPAAHYSTFFGVLPLRAAPYFAPFEETEIYEAFLEYLRTADGKTSPPLEYLLTEYCRYTLARAWGYYPGELPAEILSPEVKNGYLDRTLAIPLEDVYPGWQAPGLVGQEIYGAGGAFLYTIKAYHRDADLPFVLYCDTPTSRYTCQAAQRQVDMHLFGSPAVTCRARLIPKDSQLLPDHQVRTETAHGKETLQGTLTPEGHQEYWLPGGSDITITWAD